MHHISDSVADDVSKLRVELASLYSCTNEVEAMKAGLNYCVKMFDGVLLKMRKSDIEEQQLTSSMTVIEEDELQRASLSPAILHEHIKPGIYT